MALTCFWCKISKRLREMPLLRHAWIRQATAHCFSASSFFDCCDSNRFSVSLAATRRQPSRFCALEAKSEIWWTARDWGPSELKGDCRDCMAALTGFFRPAGVVLREARPAWFAATWGADFGICVTGVLAGGFVATRPGVILLGVWPLTPTLFLMCLLLPGVTLLPIGSCRTRSAWLCLGCACRLDSAWQSW